MIKPELAKDRKTFNKIELPEYIAERKYDGERIIAIKEGDDITLQRRSGKIATHQYPEIVRALSRIKHDVILDGEMVVFDEDTDLELFQDGISSRTHLKDEKKIYIASLEKRATYMVFDILHAVNADLRQHELLTRKKYLKRFLGFFDDYPYDSVNIVEWTDDGVALFDEAKTHGWEGIILKPKLAMYMENSRKQWIKIKNTSDTDLIFTEFEENNRGIKLIKYSTFDKDDIILTVSEDNPITIQCNGKQSEEVKERLQMDGQVLVTVSYLNLTNDYRLRMPVFKKLVEPEN